MTFYQPFIISGIIWHEIHHKFLFNFGRIADVLNQRLRFSTYGLGLEGISVIFISVPPENTIHEEVTNYNKKEKELTLHRKLSYEKASQYSETETLRLMAENYLHILAEIQSLNIPNFDSHRLYKDVQKAFLEVGWIVGDTWFPISRPVQPDMVAAYLHHKGWTTQSNTERYHILQAPDNAPFPPQKQLFIPLSPNGSAEKYERALGETIHTIAEMYGKDQLELEILFAKNKEELRATLEEWEALLK